MQTFAFAVAGEAYGVPPGASPAGRRVSGLVMVAALALYAACGWAPHLAGHRGAGTNAPSAAAAPSVDTGAVAEQANHAVVPEVGRADAMEVRDPAYRAVFDRSGFTYTPKRSSAGLSLSFAGVQRGGNPLAVQPGHWVARNNVASRSVTSGIREQVTAHAGRAEWDVVLATPPTGSGDLVVRADLAGATGRPVQVRGDSGRGWRIRLTNHSTVILGETIVRDARGHELSRALPVVTEHGIKLVVPGSTLAGAAYPVLIDPAVSNDIDVAGGLNRHDSTSVAFNGSSFLVVWQERGSGSNYVVRGSRVSSDGIVGASFLISFGSEDQEHPKVAWNGSKFLVVWEFYANSVPDVNVFGQLVSSTGTPIGGAMFISTGSTADRASAPAVAAGASSFYVVWNDGRNGNSDIYGNVVSTDGVVGANSVAVTSDPVNETVPAVAWDGHDFLVAYQYAYDAPGDYDIYSRLVGSSGVPVGTVQTINGGSDEQLTPAVASNGSEFLVVWSDNAARSGFVIAGQRVSGFGTKINGAFGISQATGTGDQTIPNVAYDGSYLVAWQDTRNPNLTSIYANRVAPDGTRQDGYGFLVTGTDQAAYTPNLSPGPKNGWGVGFERYPRFSSYSELRTIAPK